MGHSFIEFRDARIHVHDAYITWIMENLPKACEGPVLADLAELFRWWSSKGVDQGNGCLDIPFDSYLHSELAMKFVLRGLDRMEAGLLQQALGTDGAAANPILAAARKDFAETGMIKLTRIVPQLRELLSSSV